MREKSGETGLAVPPPAGNAARCLGRRRSSEATPCMDLDRPTLPGLLPDSGAARSSASSGCCQRRVGAKTRWPSSHRKMRVIALDQIAVARIDRLGDRDEAERRLDVAARLDPPPCDRD